VRYCCSRPFRSDFSHQAYNTIGITTVKAPVRTARVVGLKCSKFDTRIAWNRDMAASNWNVNKSSIQCQGRSNGRDYLIISWWIFLFAFQTYHNAALSAGMTMRICGLFEELLAQYKAPFDSLLCDFCLASSHF
jgi:hypothetical protein